MPRDLPAGTVTFLFTDIEGSTRLLHEHGERYAELLGEHRRVLREAFARHGGVEVDTQGDAFFVAFARASDAIAAASDGQAALRGGPISVRMGLHTGEPVVTEEGYVGIDVHRAARIAAAGHGGQVLLSQATCDLVAGNTVRDLGEHRLKDLSAPERLFQLGDADFPHLKALYQTNLPVPATPFLGRERELDEVLRLLRNEDVRLLTLTGPGGTGKTRLALQAAAEVAEDVPDGVWWIPLAALRDPALALDTVARALDVRERPGFTLEETLVDALAAKRALLLIDNAEHLLPDVAHTVSQLHAVGGPTLLVTSRERLKVAGEHAYPVPEFDADDAVELFLARAKAAGVQLEQTETVDELCEQLERLPLALELAAARTVVFGPEQLLERLAERLDLLKSGRDTDPRQQTLRATIEWSYGLLDTEEQRLFRALSVFAGGCTYEAAEQVVGADPDRLQSLLDKSLLRRRDAEHGPRYWMLETIREYAVEQLEHDADCPTLRNKHADHLLALGRDAREGLQSESRSAWIDLLQRELTDVRAALAWLSMVGRQHDALRLAGDLYRFWLSGNHLAEGRAVLTSLLPAATDAETRALYRALTSLGDIARHQGDLSLAQQCADRMLTIARSQDDIALEAHALASSTTIRLHAADFSQAAELCRESLVAAEAVGDTALVATALGNLTYALLGLQAYDEAKVMAERAIQASPRTDPIDLLNLGTALLGLGAANEAVEPIRNGLQVAWQDVDHLQVAHLVGTTAAIALSRGDVENAIVLGSASEAVLNEAALVAEPVEALLAARTRKSAVATLNPDVVARLQDEGSHFDTATAVERALDVLDGADAVTAS